MVKDFDTFYERVKLRVVNIIKEKEITEADLRFDKIMGRVLKEMILEDLDIKVKTVVPRDTQNYPSKSILYRNDSKVKLNMKRVGLK